MDWSTFAYGTAPYNTILLAALEATKNSSLIMDFSMGPQSGQGVPADPTNPGLSYELVWIFSLFTSLFKCFNLTG